MEPHEQLPTVQPDTQEASVVSVEKVKENAVKEIKREKVQQAREEYVVKNASTTNTSEREKQKNALDKGLGSTNDRKSRYLDYWKERAKSLIKSPEAVVNEFKKLGHDELEAEYSEALINRGNKPEEDVLAEFLQRAAQTPTKSEGYAIYVVRYEWARMFGFTDNELNSLEEYVVYEEAFERVFLEREIQEGQAQKTEDILEQEMSEKLEQVIKSRSLERKKKQPETKEERDATLKGQEALKSIALQNDEIRLKLLKLNTAARKAAELRAIIKIINDPAMTNRAVLLEKRNEIEEMAKRIEAEINNSKEAELSSVSESLDGLIEAARIVRIRLTIYDDALYRYPEDTPEGKRDEVGFKSVNNLLEKELSTVSGSYINEVKNLRVKLAEDGIYNQYVNVYLDYVQNNGEKIFDGAADVMRTLTDDKAKLRVSPIARFHIFRKKRKKDADILFAVIFGMIFNESVDEFATVKQ